MRNSPFKEHKLELSQYIKGESGGVLRAKMREEVGLSDSEIGILLQSVRPLELYIPVKTHRRSWTGGSEIIVASAPEDDGATPVGFTTAAEEFSLLAETPPARPVIVLVPVETDFSDPLPLESFENVDDADGQAVGEYRRKSSSRSLSAAQECDEGTPGCGGSGMPPPPGIYIVRNSLSDLHEPWAKGEPEIEIHTLKPTDPKMMIRCVRESGFGGFSFVQNDFIWIGSTLIGPQNDINALPSGMGLDFVIWEDDNTTCQVRTDDATWDQFAYAAFGVVGSVYSWRALLIGWGLAQRESFPGRQPGWMLTADCEVM